MVGFLDNAKVLNPFQLGYGWLEWPFRYFPPIFPCLPRLASQQLRREATSWNHIFGIFFHFCASAVASHIRSISLDSLSRLHNHLGNLTFSILFDFAENNSHTCRPEDIHPSSSCVHCFGGIQLWIFLAVVFHFNGAAQRTSTPPPSRGGWRAGVSPLPHPTKWWNKWKAKII